MKYVRSLRAWLLAAAVAGASAGLTARARGEFPGDASDGCAADPFARAGHPHWIAPWGRLTYTGNYCGYFVGGGAPLHGEPGFLCGEPRYPREGTWGMDYDPWYSRVRLHWYHGARHQGGTGQYESEHRNRGFYHLSDH